MSVVAHPEIVRATVAVDGRLLSADAPLLALQREAGGDLNTALAIPQLAALARLASRLGITISRPVVAASDQCDIDMWVQAKPGDATVHMAVIDWQERAPAIPATEGARREADIAALGDGSEGWSWAIDPQMQFRLLWDEASAEEPDDGPRPAVGSRFTAFFTLMPGADGDMAILSGFAQRRAFRGQMASLVGDPERHYLLSGAPRFDMSGRLMGYSGRAQPLAVETGGTRADDASVLLYKADFGKRLDRSLRQPLGRIIANADTISAQLEGPLREDYAAYAGDIATAGRHLMALVDDLADLQAIDRPDFSVETEEVDLADLGRRAAGLLSVKALDRRIAIEGPGEGATAPATGEFRRVLQILVNLIGNAIRYSPEGTTVRVVTEHDHGEARIMVIDQGPGVAMEDRERIFEKFERLGREDAAGSGLGLYISRRLARAMGGDIRIGGTPGEGARFIVALPGVG